MEVGPIGFEEDAPPVEVGPGLFTVEADLARTGQVNASGVDSDVEVKGDLVPVHQVALVPQQVAIVPSRLLRVLIGKLYLWRRQSWSMWKCSRLFPCLRRVSSGYA